MMINNQTMTMLWGMTYAQCAIFVGIEALFMLGGIYFIVAFAYYLWKKRHSNPDARTVGRLHNKSRRLLFALVFALIVFGLCKFSVVVFAFLAPQPMSALRCDIVEKTFQFITGIGITVLYSFLWLRQYTLYRQPQMQRLVTPYLVKMSKGLIVSIIGIGITGTVLATATGSKEHHKHLAGTNTCVFRTIIDPNSISVIIGYAFVLIWQVSLLFLFVYILRCHQRDVTQLNVACRNCKPLHKVIRNCTIAAIVAFSTDVATVVLDTILPNSIIAPIYLFMWDVNYVINIGCVIFCFANWKKMVYPWRLNSSKRSCERAVVAAIT